MIDATLVNTQADRFRFIFIEFVEIWLKMKKLNKQ